MAHGSKKVIYAALAGNTLISITKFAAAIYTGSSAMLSEGIHSLVDTGNQGLLLYGMKRASRKADSEHPFGYGVELYFWAFVVAILIFAVGAGVSIYEGIQKLLEPHPVSNPLVNFVVLGLAFVFEAAAWWIALREFTRAKGRRSYIAAVRQSKDPTVFTVLFEDSAAMLGLIIAFAGLVAAEMTGIEWFDGAASVAIGVVLAGTAVLLAFETKGLLIGEAAAPELISTVEQMVARNEAVTGLNELRTMHLGPHDVLMAISLDFNDALSAAEVEEATSDLEAEIKSHYRDVSRVFIEAQSRRRHREALERDAQRDAETGTA
ncbi:cation diffusion facilitator family transporter [Breoghania corrubedonensis]|uniref:Cation diffusion facilitator family transporter n=1 Tax=Breoghania corrubedonensis TaxID=665038 RepID=A0A2T5V8K6_9HYPH|nr:cation diffusion facilitator family transporter [Breoghania corrubedonensis]PTW60095.1 cation diffusion facilitator family transporter [Breoghania corrubedonensis]